MDALTQYHQIIIQQSKETADDFFISCEPKMCQSITQEIHSNGYAKSNGEFLAFYCLHHERRYGKKFIMEE